MAKKTAPLLPASAGLLRQFGDRLRLARLRRRLPAKQVAERAGMAPMTLRSLERGGAGVTMGAYLAVMQVLGIEKDLNLLGQVDAVGRELQDAQLPARARTTRPATPPADKQSETAKLPIPGDDVTAELRRAIEKLPAEQLRELFSSLPGEQMQKALAAMSPSPAHEERDRLESPPNEGQTSPMASEDVRDWISKGDFASSEALADLLDPSAPLKKVR
ncbi:helix-turn-helix domain-containing protein [Polaromonas sp. YR568]|uniref:helix-turn-helix domain-containing protein n=1 Tax=Polaromonas sp. YR568 TaxID=1855301 RepID=UPI00398C02C9